jgi:hypothetical protein
MNKKWLNYWKKSLSDGKFNLEVQQFFRSAPLVGGAERKTNLK